MYYPSYFKALLSSYPFPCMFLFPSLTVFFHFNSLPFLSLYFLFFVLVLVEASSNYLEKSSPLCDSLPLITAFKHYLKILDNSISVEFSIFFIFRGSLSFQQAIIHQTNRIIHRFVLFSFFILPNDDLTLYSCDIYHLFCDLFPYFDDFLKILVLKKRL